ncbi:ArsR family transcriptional regulator [Streptomyces nigrescens]|uniref:ArsR family transcriptional regulator n=2 Tax=Streptomyces TaxID=1883 RepID=A0ABN6R182_STRNI|nr:winged helix-turn-helix domain-containing protein [Streptomyces nigrescens]MEE4422300.1 winged helix-turn-helix domain-containing protein [Streptomyces sp. DSM 41528]BDM72189.1 ArsR family transcriptional regulator [Streptomyces nigrescens]
MPLHLHFGADDLLRIRFAISPLCETHEAVRTLRRTDRHGYHAPWLRRMRTALAGLDLTPLWLFMPASPPGYTPDFLGRPPDTPTTGFDEELARLRATDPELARAEMAKSLACTPGGAESARGRAALADPARAVQELADVTERAWHALLAPDWPRLRALLEAEIAYRSRQLADGGLRRLFADLHPRLTWSGDTLTVRTRTDFRQTQDLGGRGVLLLPSVFAWPDVVSGFDPPWQPTVIYPARGIGGLWSEPDAGPALARLLGPKRAAVLAALDAPSTTTALSRRLGLAPSSVSAHLSVLRAAGLLTSHRHGHEVLYEQTPLGLALLG